ncbi:MAG: enoyl-CoA hydratase/isomerase family protein [Planctomycetota bacterium]
MSVRIQDTDGVRTITLDRPEKRNALTDRMLDAAATAIETVGDAGCILLLGAGRVFSAGFDLKAADERTAPGVLQAQILSLSRVLEAIGDCAVPVVVGAQRAAIAGASAIVSAADLVVADRAAVIGYPVTRLGISPAVSGPTLERAALGAARALLLDPRTVTAQRAHELGLVHELVDAPDGVGTAAGALAASIASKPGGGVRATKAWVRTVSGAIDHAAAREASLASIDSETIERLRSEVWSR